MTLLRSLEELQSTLAREYGQSRGTFIELAHIETLLADTYRDRIQYEMLQNSDDAGATAVAVAVNSDGVVTWVNNGRPFRIYVDRAAGDWMRQCLIDLGSGWALAGLGQGDRLPRRPADNHPVIA